MNIFFTIKLEYPQENLMKRKEVKHEYYSKSSCVSDVI